MPRDSSHLEQNEREAAIQHAAQVFKDVLKFQGLPIPPDVYAADSYYAKDDRIIPQLCAHLNALSKPVIEDLLYSDARNKRRRNIADWYEKHADIDQEREEDEREAADQAALRASARAKLTPAELNALENE